MSKKTGQEILAGLERLGDRPALVSGARIWSGEQLRTLSLDIRRRPGGQSEDGAQVLAYRLAAMLLDEQPENEFCASLAEWCRTLEQPAVRMAILSPLAGFGGDAALAAWSAGMAVHHEVASLHPARALTFLERAAADCAVLPHPALALSDLAPLRCVFYDGTADSMLSAGDIATARRLLRVDVAGWIASDGAHVPASREQQRLEREAARIESLATLHPSVAEAAVVPTQSGQWTIFVVPAAQQRSHSERDEASARVVDEAKTLLDDAFTDLDLTAAIRVTETLSRTALLSMLHALSRSDLFSTPDAVHSEHEVFRMANVASAHQPLIRRWLRVLTEQGLLRFVGDGWSSTLRVSEYSDDAQARAWAELEADWRATLGSSGTIEYARRNAERLPELIRGEQQAVHLLFPEGRTELARALYRESIAARYQHHAVRTLVSGIAAGRDRIAARKPLRILEVGAGTGATSELLLPALVGRDVDYLYTDVSTFFLNQAAERLRAYPFVHFGLYDIDVAPRTQGFAANEYDVVIGGGVLNAARNSDASVRWLTELLSADGWLILTEPTVEEFWVLASQAFMLAEASDGRVSTEATFLSRTQWNAVLDGAGLRRVLDLPEQSHPLHPLGHRVFAARAKQDRVVLCTEDLIEHLDGRGCSGARIDVVDALPRLPNGQLDRDALGAWARRPQRVDWPRSQSQTFHTEENHHD